MSDYAFVTLWRARAPRDEVWDAIVRVEEWPRWWRGVRSVEKLRDGDANGVGAVHRYVWRSRLPYDLAFTMETVRVVRPERIEGRATGELEGEGLWTLTEEDGGRTTGARYDWNVRTTKPWMNLLAPIARPFFAWNHDVVMGWGARGLAARLNAPVEDLS